MDILDLINCLADEGIDDVKKCEYKPEKEAAFIRGFEQCRDLAGPMQFTYKLIERHKREKELMGPEYDSEEDYWPYRWETTQIEYVWEVVKVAMGISPHYASAARRYAQIVGVKEE